MKTKISLSLALVVLLASPALAADASLDTALAEMGSSSGDSYLAARAKVTGRASAQKDLEAKLDGASWTDETFTTLAMATIAHAHVAHPDVVARVNHLQGVNPEQYLKRRRAEPECGRELEQLGADAVGPLLELYLKTFDRYDFSRDREDLALKERVALRTGIVIALAESKHPSAFFVCRDVLRNPREPEAVRLQAAEGLGAVATDAALSELVATEENVENLVAIRLAAIRGAARIPARGALSFLVRRLSDENQQVRDAAVVGLGTFGSAWAWESRGPELAKQGEDLRREASVKLVEALRAGNVAGDSVVDSLATIAHEGTPSLLEKTIADETTKDSAKALAKTALVRVKMAIERNAR